MKNPKNININIEHIDDIIWQVQHYGTIIDIYDKVINNHNITYKTYIYNKCIYTIIMCDGDIKSFTQTYKDMYSL